MEVALGHVIYERPMRGWLDQKSGRVTKNVGGKKTKAMAGKGLAWAVLGSLRGWQGVTRGWQEVVFRWQEGALRVQIGSLWLG